MNYYMVKKQLAHLSVAQINQLALEKERTCSFLEAYYMFLYNARTYPSYKTVNNLGFFCSDIGSWSLNGKKKYDMREQECELYFLRALLLKPNEISFSNLATLYMQKNRWLEAKCAIQRAMTWGYTFYNCNAMGCICYAEKNYSEAMQWFKKALDVYEKNSIYTEDDRRAVLYSYGMCAVQLPKSSETEKFWRRALIEAEDDLGYILYLYYADELEKILCLYSKVEENKWILDPWLFTIFLYAVYHIVPNKTEEFFRFATQYTVIENQFYPLRTYECIYKEICDGKKPQILYEPDRLYVNGYVLI